MVLLTEWEVDELRKERDNLLKLVEKAFLAGIEFQIYNENGTDIEGWREAFNSFLAAE